MKAEVAWKGFPYKVAETFGLIPDGYQGETEDLPNDEYMFYWLDAEEWQQFKIGFTNGEWTVTDIL